MLFLCVIFLKYFLKVDDNPVIPHNHPSFDTLDKTFTWEVDHMDKTFIWEVDHMDETFIWEVDHMDETFIWEVDHNSGAMIIAITKLMYHQTEHFKFTNCKIHYCSLT